MLPKVQQEKYSSHMYLMIASEILQITLACVSYILLKGPDRDALIFWTGVTIVLFITI